MKFAKFLIVLTAVVLLCSCAESTSPNIALNSNSAKPAASPQMEVTPMTDQLAAGRKIYTDNCAACHKEDGTGGKMEFDGKSISPDDLTAEKIKAFSDDKITGYIYKGIEDEGMPAFKDKLSEAEIREVVRYVRAGIQKMPPTVDKKPTR